MNGGRVSGTSPGVLGAALLSRGVATMPAIVMTASIRAKKRFRMVSPALSRRGIIVAAYDSTGCSRWMQPALLRPIRRFVVYIADKIGQVGMSQHLPNRHALAGVIPIVVD